MHDVAAKTGPTRALARVMHASVADSRITFTTEISLDATGAREQMNTNLG